MKKVLWILVVLLPLGAAALTLHTLQAVQTEYAIILPQYSDKLENTLAGLEKKSLLLVSATLLNDHKRLVQWSRSASQAYEALVFVLLTLVILLAAMLAMALWRLPSGTGATVRS